MENNKISFSKLIPVLATFAVMGFVDIVGVSSGYAKQDFGLSDTQAQLIPAMAFLWFLLLSVPAGILQDRYGKKLMMNTGLIITGIGHGGSFRKLFFPGDAGRFRDAGYWQYRGAGRSQSSATGW